jgi:hypothetical protein
VVCLAERSWSTCKALGSSKPRRLGQHGAGTTSGNDTSRIVPLDGFTLAVPAASQVVALEGLRPSPVDVKDELALLFTFAVCTNEALLQTAAGVEPGASVLRDGTEKIVPSVLVGLQSRCSA